MTKAKKDSTPKWRGDEVQQRSPGEAERGADRAESNRAISVAEAVHGSGKPRAKNDDDSTEGSTAQGDDADAKTAEAAEEHRARLLSDNRPPRKTL